MKVLLVLDQSDMSMATIQYYLKNCFEKKTHELIILYVHLQKPKFSRADQSSIERMRMRNRVNRKGSLGSPDTSKTLYKELTENELETEVESVANTLKTRFGIEDDVPMVWCQCNPTKSRDIIDQIFDIMEDLHFDKIVMACRGHVRLQRRNTLK